ncbi:Rieske (2Fe-2S) protein [Streptacidiphilus neutrinimicus]|uniref:Rieske (2Fe-2S) protein n=1 Tax=Streptacidiphilus neutrinimicus TaxID=105420 RepID=UPI0005AA95CE|nr:Rieske (2Fe-2S) protein [Streptacidiphilus neutrinimicus]
MTTTPQRTNEDEPDNAQPAAHLPARRTLLAGAGVVGVSAVLAACSSAGGSSSSDAPPSQQGAAGAPSSAPSSAPSQGGGSAGGGGTGTVLGATSDVPVGGGKVFAAEKVVVTQPTAGNFKCFTAVCTHQGCTVSSVSGGTINCPCHGSQFHITDGSVAGGPAPSPLAEEKISVSGGQISLT